MKRNGKVGNVRLMQRLNRARVFDCIRRSGQTTRPAISAETGLSLSSITNIVSYLLEKEFVCESDVDHGGHLGRKATLLKINEDKYSIACITLDSRKRVRGVCMDLCGGVRFETEVRTSLKTEEDTKNAVARVIGKIIEENGRGNLVAAAISVPGMVLDGGRETVSASMRWTGLDLRTPLSEKFAIPVFVQNASIARAMWTLKELRGQTEEMERNSVFIDLEQGIGAVQFMDASVNPFFLGEIGHTTSDINGKKCTCGNRGCLELYCSAENVISEYETASGKPLSFEGIVEASRSGDKEAVSVLGDCGKYLGAVFASVIHLIGPSKIYINGAQLLESDIIFDTAKEYAVSHCYKQLVKDIEYVKVSALDSAELEGLLEYCLDRLFDYESRHCIIE
ncbi:MAG: ROK family protein [Clostridiales bacterium]|nr:ROK family protein [Clostridiales bacterium]